MNRIHQRINFLKTAICDRKVAAVTMSSTYLIRRVAKLLPKRLDTVIEFGPGEGVMTRALLKRLSFQGKLFAVETNGEFIKILERIDDPRLSIIQGKAEDVVSHMQKRSQDKVDLVIASIPFSFLKSHERRKLVNDTHDILLPGGSFIVFNQYNPLMYAPVKKIFGAVSVFYELRNILPCFIIRAKKR